MPLLSLAGEVRLRQTRVVHVHKQQPESASLPDFVEALVDDKFVREVPATDARNLNGYNRSRMDVPIASSRAVHS